MSGQTWLDTQAHRALLLVGIPVGSLEELTDLPAALPRRGLTLPSGRIVSHLVEAAVVLVVRLFRVAAIDVARDSTHGDIPIVNCAMAVRVEVGNLRT